MLEWDRGKNILKLMLKVEGDTLRDFANNLNRMNLNSAVLFPGLDGFGIFTPRADSSLQRVIRLRIEEPD